MLKCNYGLVDVNVSHYQSRVATELVGVKNI
jgi:hypothetical protein